jgi:hypothetical protein
MIPNPVNHSAGFANSVSIDSSLVDADRLLTAFFQRELPRQWPEPPHRPCVTTRSASMLKDRQAEFTNHLPRWTLAACLMGMLMLGFWLSSLMIPQQGGIAPLTASSPPERLLNQAHADGQWMRETASPDDSNASQ